MNLKIGDKVKIPLGKLSYGGRKWEDSDLIGVLLPGQDYLYVRDKTEHTVSVAPSMSYDNSGSYSIYYERDLELYEEPLPQKWCIQRTPENSEEINKWLNSIDSPLKGTYRDSIGYIHFPFSGNSNGSVSAIPQPNYVLIDIHTFRKITNTQMNDKKIIGYKLLKDVADAKAGTIGRIEGNKVIFSSLDDLKDEEDYIPESFYSLKFCENSKDWFEPIYKEELKEETIYVGSPSKKVIINSKGFIQVWTDNHTAMSYKIQDILSLKSLLKPPASNWNGLTVNVEMLKIGCDQGTRVTKSEIQNVIDLYDKLNPKK